MDADYLIVIVGLFVYCALRFEIHKEFLDLNKRIDDIVRKIDFPARLSSSREYFGIAQAISPLSGRKSQKLSRLGGLLALGYGKYNIRERFITCSGRSATRDVSEKPSIPALPIAALLQADQVDRSAVAAKHPDPQGKPLVVVRAPAFPSLQREACAIS